MVKLDYDKEKKVWIELPSGSKEGIYLDGKLMQVLDFAKKQQKADDDAAICIVGSEGSGKSSFGFNMGYYLGDTKFSLNNVAVDSHDAARKLEGLPTKSVLVIDEGSLMFSSGDAMVKEQKDLIKILNVCRQKNMILIVIAPSFFRLNSYVAVDRTSALLRVYKHKGERGYFEYYGNKKKAKLYVNGKKNFNTFGSVRPNFRGRFTKFDMFGDEYLKIKEASLKSAFAGFKNDKKPSKIDFRRDMIIKIKERNPELTQQEIANLVGIHRKTVSEYLSANKQLKVA